MQIGQTSISEGAAGSNEILQSHLQEMVDDGWTLLHYAVAFVSDPSGSGGYELNHNYVWTKP